MIRPSPKATEGDGGPWFSSCVLLTAAIDLQQCKQAGLAVKLSHINVALMYSSAWSMRLGHGVVTTQILQPAWTQQLNKQHNAL